MKPIYRDRIETVLEPFGRILQPLGCVLFCSMGWLVSGILSLKQ